MAAFLAVCDVIDQIRATVDTIYLIAMYIRDSFNFDTVAEFLPSRLLFIFKFLVANNQRISGYGRQESLDKPWIISLGKNMRSMVEIRLVSFLVYRVQSIEPFCSSLITYMSLVVPWISKFLSRNH